MADEDDTLSTTQAGKLLDLSGRRMQQMAERGQIDAYRDKRGHWRISRKAVDRLIRQRLWEASKLARIMSEPVSGPYVEPQPSSGLEREIGRLQGQIEILREQLEWERQRADILQAERDSLRAELDKLRGS